MTERPLALGKVVNPDGPVLPLYDDESRNATDDDERPNEDGLAWAALNLEGPV